LKNLAGQLHAEAIGVMLPVAQKSKWKFWVNAFLDTHILPPQNAPHFGEWVKA
jgi:hypothetical protein